MFYDFKILPKLSTDDGDDGGLVETLLKHP